MASSREVFRGYSCFWRIENFTSLKPSSDLSLKSPTFHVVSLSSSNWYLVIEQDDAESLGIYLFLDKGPKYSGINFSICILTNGNWTYILKRKWRKFKVTGDGFGVENFIRWDNIIHGGKKCLPDGTLTVSVLMSKGSVNIKPSQCFIASKIVKENDIHHLPIQEFSSLKPSTLVNLSTSSMSSLVTNSLKKWVQTKSSQTETTEDTNMFDDLEDLLRLFEEKKFTNVTLRAENKEFMAQKALLCSRSPVFNAMFERDMKENESNSVSIKDVDGDTLSALMHFLHLESLVDLNWDSAIKLYYAADKYQIALLKEKCILAMVKELSAENICEALIMADMHQDELLKKCAMVYFFKNSKKILRSSEWKNLTLNRIDLASEILCDLSENMV